MGCGGKAYYRIGLVARSHYGRFHLYQHPAQHFSGRGLTDRDKTLWSSWVIQTTKEKIFFSGDSGYGPHFKPLGKSLGHSILR
ncbi:MBL fold metallo-hydrolase [Winogradskyella maritima]|nr:MBL fold metallo-hydrolase [Winogradskyella maritima]